MKFNGSHFGLLFLTSPDLEPEDFLNQLSFTAKMSAIFAPWDTAISNIGFPDTEGLKAIRKSAEQLNLVVENTRRKFIFQTIEFDHNILTNVIKLP